MSVVSGNVSENIDAFEHIICIINVTTLNIIPTDAFDTYV